MLASLIIGRMWVWHHCIAWPLPLKGLTSNSSRLGRGSRLLENSVSAVTGTPLRRHCTAADHRSASDLLSARYALTCLRRDTPLRRLPGGYQYSTRRGGAGARGQLHPRSSNKGSSSRASFPERADSRWMCMCV